MSTLVLSLLLLLLVAVGLMMGVRLAETFENPPAAAAPTVSPALQNLLNTPGLVAATATAAPPQVDKLSRDKEIADVANAASLKAERECPKHECPKCPDCKKCPECPDMSQYIKLNEVPCWNCSLP